MTESDLLTGYNKDTSFNLKLDTLQRLDSVFNTEIKNVDLSIPNYNVSSSQLDTNLTVSQGLMSEDARIRNLAMDTLIKAGTSDPFAKYNLGADISVPYEQGAKFLNKKYGFDALRDNEDFYYKNVYLETPWYFRYPLNSLKFSSRITSGVITKFIEGFGYLGRGIFEIGDEIASNIFGYENNAWADIADNSFSKLMKNADQNFRDYITPVYKQAGFDEKGFFSKLTDWTFWNDNVADGLAFLGSAIIPAGIASKAGWLTKGATTFGKLNTLSRGALGTITGAESMGELGLVAFNVANEASFEAAETFKSYKQKLIDERNRGLNNLSDSEIDNEAGKKASSTFGWNTAMLGFSQSFEMQNIYKPLIGKLNASNKVNNIFINATGEAVEKTPTLFNNKFLNKIRNLNLLDRTKFYGKKGVKGLISEGYWEENMQLAISRASEEEYLQRKADGTSEEQKVESGPFGILSQYLKQTKDATTILGIGEGDIEASESIGLGGLIALIGGGLGSKFGQRINPITGESSFTLGERKQTKLSTTKLVSDINNVRNNLFSLNDVYKEDGTIDKEKLSAKLEKFEDFVYKQQIIDQLKNNEKEFRKEDVQFLENSLMNDYVKNLAKVGKVEQAISRFQEMAGRQPQQGEEIVANPLEKAEYIKSVYDIYKNIEERKITNKRPNSLNQSELESIDRARKDRAFELIAERIALQPLYDFYQKNITDAHDKINSFLQGSILGENIEKTLSENRAVDYIREVEKKNFYENLLKEENPSFLKKVFENKKKEAEQAIEKLNELTGENTIYKDGKVSSNNPILQNLIDSYSNIYKNKAVLDNNQDRNDETANAILDPNKGFDNWTEYIEFQRGNFLKEQEKPIEETTPTETEIETPAPAPVLENKEENTATTETTSTETMSIETPLDTEQEQKTEEETLEEEPEIFPVITITIPNAEKARLIKERDEKLKPLQEEKKQIEEEIAKIEKELEEKTEDVKEEEQKKEDEKQAPTPEETKNVEEGVKEAIATVLTEEEKDVLTEVAEENKKEGQTTEEFIAEQVVNEAQGKPITIKGTPEKQSAFRRIIRKILKFLAAVGILWITANPIANFLSRNDIVSREKTTFVLDLVRAPDFISEKSFTKEQNALLATIIENAEKKGRQYVTYEDYPSGYAGVRFTESEVSENSDETVIKRTLGQFSFRRINNADGTQNYFITDKYNFNDAGQKSFSEKIDYIKEGLEDDKLSSYGKIRRVGTAFGSPDGSGSDVVIEIPTNNIKEMSSNILALGVLGMIFGKRQRKEPITPSDLEKLKERLKDIDIEINSINQEYENLLSQQEDEIEIFSGEINDNKENLINKQSELEQLLTTINDDDNPVIEKIDDVLTQIENKIEELNQAEEEERIKIEEEEKQLEEKRRQEEELKRQQEESVDVEEITEEQQKEIDLEKSVIYETPLITSKQDSINIDDEGNRVSFETETRNEKMNPDGYSEMRAEFLQAVFNESDFNDNYELFIVKDTFQGVYQETVDRDGNPVVPTGEVIIVKRKDGTTPTVSDFFKGYNKFKDQPIVFSFDKGMFFNEPLYSYRVALKAMKLEMSFADVQKENEELAEFAKRARTIVTKNPNDQVSISVLSSTYGMYPTTKDYEKVQDRFGDFEIEIIQPTIQGGDTSTQFNGEYRIGTVVFKTKDVHYRAHTMKLAKTPLYANIMETLNYEFDSFEDANRMRNEYLNVIVNTNEKQFFYIRKVGDKHKIEFKKVLKDESFTKPSDIPTRNEELSKVYVNVSKQALEKGYTIFNPKDGTFESYDEKDYNKFIKEYITTNYKRIYDKTGKKIIKKLLNPYFSFTITDPRVTSPQNNEDVRENNYQKVFNNFKEAVKKGTFDIPTATDYVVRNKLSYTEDRYRELMQFIENQRPKIKIDFEERKADLDKKLREGDITKPMYNFSLKLLERQRDQQAKEEVELTPEEQPTQTIVEQEDFTEIKNYVKYIYEESKKLGDSGLMKRVKEKLTHVNSPTLEKDKKYIRLSRWSDNTINKLEVVTGTGESFEYSFKSAYTGVGSVKNQNKKFPKYINEEGKLINMSTPEELGDFFEIPKIIEEQSVKTREQALKEAEEKWAANVDSRGFPKESLQPILQKINEEYDIIEAKTKSLEKSIKVEVSKEIESKVEEIKNNSTFIKLSPDEKFYINEKTGEQYIRVTSFISDEEIDQNNELVKSSLIIGSKVDELVRDFFEGKLKNYNKYNLSTKSEIEGFISQLEVIKQNLQQRGEIVIANGITLYDEVAKIAGTVDLLTYDANGSFRIYDIKTMRGNNFEESYVGEDVNKYESTLYGKSKKQKHTEQLSLYRIMLNNTHDVKASTIGILPVEIDYKKGEQKTKKLNVLKGVQLTPLEEVNNISLKNVVSLPQKEEVKIDSKEVQKTKSRFAGKKKVDVAAVIAGKEQNKQVEYKFGEYIYNPLTNEIEGDEAILKSSKFGDIMEQFYQNYPFTKIGDVNTGFSKIVLQGDQTYTVYGAPTTALESEIVVNENGLRITNKPIDFLRAKLEEEALNKLNEFLKRNC